MNSNDNLNETNESIVDFERALLDFVRPPDSEILMKYLEVFADRYNFLSLEYLGTSILGKRIPIVKLGDDRAERQIMYIGAHHGMEWITSIILLRFINEYCENLRSDNRMFNINMKYLYKSRLLCIIPMLNPDGVDMQLHGISPDNPIKDRVISMNGGSENFSKF